MAGKSKSAIDPTWRLKLILDCLVEGTGREHGWRCYSSPRQDDRASLRHQQQRHFHPSLTNSHQRSLLKIKRNLS